MPVTRYNRLRKRLSLSGIYLGVLADIAEFSALPSGVNGVRRERVTRGERAREQAVNYLISRRFIVPMWDGRLRIIDRASLAHFRHAELWIPVAREGYAHHDRRVALHAS